MFQMLSKKKVCWKLSRSQFGPLTPEDNDKYSANEPTTLSANQAASQSSSLSMYNYSALVIIGNEKNKLLTLLSQCKLAFTRRYM
jgi:hypothetical protein